MKIFILYKKQSFEAFEKESVRIYNDTQAANIGKYKEAATDAKLKQKYKAELYNALRPSF